MEEVKDTTSSLSHSPTGSNAEKHVPFDTVPESQTTADQEKSPMRRGNHGLKEEQTSANANNGPVVQSNGQQYDEERQIQQETDETNAELEKEFEVGWDGDNDPMNPKSKSLAQKWLIVLILAASSLCVTCASALYTFTYTQIEPEFHVSREVATVGLSTFVCGLALGPMFLAPLSEFYGRRPIYIGAFGMYLIWLIPCAVANNIATMLVARFFDGLAGSAFLSVAGGTVGDMFSREQLSLPMMIYTASPFLGPEVGPVIGGFINQYTNWRWSFYVLLIWAGVLWVVIIFLVPETYHPVLLKRKAERLRKETGNPNYKAPMEKMQKSLVKTVLWSCVRPFQLLVFEPMCLLLCMESAVLLGILYLFFGAFPLIFENHHGFSLSQVGLTFLSIMIGMLIGICCDPLWRRNYMRLVRNNGGKSEPEFRLPPTIVYVTASEMACMNLLTIDSGAVIVPFALIGRDQHCAYAWPAQLTHDYRIRLYNLFFCGSLFPLILNTGTDAILTGTLDR